MFDKIKALILIQKCYGEKNKKFLGIKKAHTPLKTRDRFSLALSKTVARKLKTEYT